MYIERACGRWGEAEREIASSCSTLKCAVFGPRARPGGADLPRGIWAASGRPPVPFCPLPDPSSGRGLPSPAVQAYGLALRPQCLRSPSPSGPGSLRPNAPERSASPPFGCGSVAGFAPHRYAAGPPLPTQRQTSCTKGGFIAKSLGSG